jgi:hypothetical protein
MPPARAPSPSTPRQLGEVVLILLPTAFLTDSGYQIILSRTTASETLELAGVYCF